VPLGLSWRNFGFCAYAKAKFFGFVPPKAGQKELFILEKACKAKFCKGVSQKPKLQSKSPSGTVELS
jgi:hypothetical protein